MKCYSRSTLGVLIGIINIIIYIGVCSAMVFIYLDSENKTGRIKILLASITAVCIIMIVISGLLILGIFKKLHKFIWPWLLLTGLGFACNSGRAVLALILGIINNIPFNTLVLTLAIDVLAVAIQALIIWPIYTLCRDIGRKNSEQPRRHRYVASCAL